MKTYIGVKIVQAEPCTLGDYNTRRGWQIPANEDPTRAGFFLKYPDGYVSWSPREIFNAAYRLVSAEERGLVVGVKSNETFYDRLLAESQQLEERFEKLSGYLETDAFRALPDADQSDLKAQYEAMGEYRDILGRRITRLQPPVARQVRSLEDEAPVVGEIKTTGGDHSETPVPFGGE